MGKKTDQVWPLGSARQCSAGEDTFGRVRMRISTPLRMLADQVCCCLAGLSVAGEDTFVGLRMHISIPLCMLNHPLITLPQLPCNPLPKRGPLC